MIFLPIVPIIKWKMRPRNDSLICYFKSSIIMKKKECKKDHFWKVMIRKVIQSIRHYYYYENSVFSIANSMFEPNRNSIRQYHHCLHQQLPQWVLHLWRLRLYHLLSRLFPLLIYLSTHTLLNLRVFPMFIIRHVLTLFWPLPSL